MSYQPATDPTCTSTGGSIDVVIKPHAKDLGGFSVRRVLPAHERRMVGPFIFFDHMGPAEFPPGEGIQVRPHPHIGLATITYLFEGQIMHRDSLGYAQAIRPGAINLMTAGRGIVHSERAGDDLDKTSRLHGIQSWMALPTDEEECDPAFQHFPASALPELVQDQVAIRVIMGEVWGERSPVPSYLPMLYLECRMPAGSVLTLPDNYDERAAYVVDGSIEIDSQELASGLMAVAHPGKAVRVHAKKESHVMIIGGTNPGHRHIWWNFVSSSKERITKAKVDWRENRFEMVPGDTEFIPLPD